MRKQLENGSYSTLEQFEVGAHMLPNTTHVLLLISRGLDMSCCKSTAKLPSDVLQCYMIFLSYGWGA